MYFWVGSSELGGVGRSTEMKEFGWTGGKGMRCGWSGVGMDGAEFEMGGAELGIECPLTAALIHLKEYCFKIMPAALLSRNRYSF